MKLNTIVNFLNEELKVDEFKNLDISMNGLQVENLGQSVEKICFAVDACADTIEQAVEEGADLLVVHHGLFWGKPIPLVRSHYNRIKALLDGNLALYACHLPLDAHPKYGNNVQIARALGLFEIKPFLNNIGCKGILEEDMSCTQIARIISGQSSGLAECILPFGTENIKTVGICSGAASMDVGEAIKVGLDAYITGDCRHEIYHTCKEEQMNLISLGHYCTETFGVKALKQLIETEFKTETSFIDIPVQL